MTKLIIDNVFTKVESSDVDLLNFIDSELAIKDKRCFFDPEFKNGRWDGYVRFFNRDTKTFPTGLLYKLLDLPENDFELVDNRKYTKRVIPAEIDLYEPDAPEGKITLRDYQYLAVYNAMDKLRGIVHAATNSGKTEIASGMIKVILPTLKKEERIIFVTHSKEIMHQSAERIARRLNINVGKIGDGIWNLEQVSVVMVPTIARNLKAIDGAITYRGEMSGVKLILDLAGSAITKNGKGHRQTLLNLLAVVEEEYRKLQRREEPCKDEERAIDILVTTLANEKTDKGIFKLVEKMKKSLAKYEEKELRKKKEKTAMAREILESVRCFIGDEMHHSASNTWQDTLNACTNAVYRFGLTGTIDAKDEISMLKMYGQTGRPVITIRNELLISRGFSAKPTIYMTPIKTPKLGKANFQVAYQKGIVENKYRNKIIAEQVKKRYDEGKGCLIIVNRKEHGENLKDRLMELGVECEFTHGSYENREGVLKDMTSGKLKVLIATTILDEGVDIAGINCLWMAAGMKSYRMVLQRVGRGIRKKADGSGLEVYDFLDDTSDYLKSHTRQRFSYYKDEGFEIKKYEEN